MIQIEGAISVKAAIESKQRFVKEVYIHQDKISKDIDYLLSLCHRNKIKVNRVSEESLKTFNPSKTFGGILAHVEPRSYQTIQNLIHMDWLVLIEGIEDPFNLGQMIRTAYASGAQAILLSDRDWSSVESTLLKSSAGAFDRINIVLMKDVFNDLGLLRKSGFKLISALRNTNSISHHELVFPKQSILAIGGELRGLSRAVKDASDISVEIKYPNAAKVALNAVSACAILCFKHVQ